MTPNFPEELLWKNRNVNDGISTKTIAEYLIAYPEKVSYNTDDPYSSLRKQWNFTEMLKKAYPIA